MQKRGRGVLPRITTDNANSLRSAIKVAFSCQPKRYVQNVQAVQIVQSV
jgi:hypothetical protein